VDSAPTQALTPLPDDPNALLRRDELPRYLPVSAQTLARWACEGRGPRYIRIGKRVVYRCSDLTAWLESRSPQHKPAS
jgi:predicted DNA-binding transcriptional regulator AlpA